MFIAFECFAHREVIIDGKNYQKNLQMSENFCNFARFKSA